MLPVEFLLNRDCQRQTETMPSRMHGGNEWPLQTAKAKDLSD
jgi:hypothetical protein